MNEKSVDLIITDPPFAIEFNKNKGSYNRNKNLVIGGYQEIKSEQYSHFTQSWMKGAKRVLKDSGSMYVLSGTNNLYDILDILNRLKFTVVNHIIWKYQFGVVTKRKFVTSHYHCLYVCLDDKKRYFNKDCRYSPDEKDANKKSLQYSDKEDVWIINREYWTGCKKTPNKLPAELIKKMLQYSSQEGDLILDPFLGSGQVAIVSKELNRNYIGFEIVSAYYEFAKKRLNSGEYFIKE